MKMMIIVVMIFAAAEAMASHDYKAGDKVKVQRKGEPYPATVKSYNAVKKCWNIHYDNTSDSWDECVGKKRIK